MKKIISLLLGVFVPIVFSQPRHDVLRSGHDASEAWLKSRYQQLMQVNVQQWLGIDTTQALPAINLDDPNIVKQLATQAQQATATNDSVNALRQSRAKRPPLPADQTALEKSRQIAETASTDHAALTEDAFCLTPDCKSHQTLPGKDFDKSITALSSAFEAIKTQDERDGRLFSGKRLTCSDDMANFKNCCRNKGWGKDIHLAHCTREEKALGVAKQAGRAVVLGRYCHHKFLGHCVSHHKAYCVFPSKLAAIIQRQGRLGQLGIDFGSAQASHCRGITPTEFAKLDLDKMDFRAVYQSIRHKMTSPAWGSIDSQSIEQQLSTQTTAHTTTEIFPP